jgi:signal transduction histidine kinase
MGQKYMRLVANAVDSSLAVININGRVVRANQNFTRLFGSNPNLQQNELFLKMLKVSESGLARLLLSPGIDQSNDCAQVNAGEGKTLYLSYQLKTIHNKLILSQVRDITEEKSRDFALAKDKERLIEAGENIFHLAHALKGSSYLLDVNLSMLETNPTVDRLIQISRRQSDIIKDFLRSSSEVDVQLSEINPAQLINEIILLPETVARLGNIQVTVSGQAAPFEGVHGKLREALVCLFNNAVDAIQAKEIADGRITINISQQTGENSAVLINIEDNGIGIPADKMGIIFKMFFTSKRHGTGTGLGFASRVVEDLHGGRISVSSQIGVGSSFAVHLPRKPIITKPAPEKLDWVRQKLSQLGEEYIALADQCINSMTHEHIRINAPEQLFSQIRGQIDRLNGYISTKIPHISVNNFAPRTEIVLVADKDSASRDFWQNAILHELKTLGDFELANVSATRKLEKGRSVCRIFEIRTFEGGRVTDEVMTNLEKVLTEKITPLPTIEEIETQNRFMNAAFQLFASQKAERGSLHSLTYKPAVNTGVLRLVGYKVKVYRDDPVLESLIPQRYLIEIPPLAGIFSFFAERLKDQSGFLLTNERITEHFLESHGVGDFTKRLVSSFDINSALAAIIQLSNSAIVINLLCSTAKKKFPLQVEEEFRKLNQAWKDSYPA